MQSEKEIHMRYRQIVTARYNINGSLFMWADYVTFRHPSVEKVIYWATKRLLERECSDHSPVQVKDGKIYRNMQQIGTYSIRKNPQYKEQNYEQEQRSRAGNH